MTQRTEPDERRALRSGHRQAPDERKTDECPRDLPQVKRRYGGKDERPKEVELLLHSNAPKVPRHIGARSDHHAQIAAEDEIAQRVLRRLSRMEPSRWLKEMWDRREDVTADKKEVERPEPKCAAHKEGADRNRSVALRLFGEKASHEKGGEYEEERHAEAPCLDQSAQERRRIGYERGDAHVQQRPTQGMESKDEEKREPADAIKGRVINPRLLGGSPRLGRPRRVAGRGRMGGKRGNVHDRQSACTFSPDGSDRGPQGSVILPLDMDAVALAAGSWRTELAILLARNGRSARHLSRRLPSSGSPAAPCA